MEKMLQRGCIGAMETKITVQLTEAQAVETCVAILKQRDCLQEFIAAEQVRGELSKTLVNEYRSRLLSLNAALDAIRGGRAAAPPEAVIRREPDCQGQIRRTPWEK